MTVNVTAEEAVNLLESWDEAASLDRLARWIMNPHLQTMLTPIRICESAYDLDAMIFVRSSDPLVYSSSLGETILRYRWSTQPKP